MLRFPKFSLNWLLVCVVPALVVRFWPGARHDVLLFVLSGLAIIPLSGLMGRATERLAERLGAGVGGLLNATFGNAAELIIALIALHKGLFGVVKASITGSIIGNILLVFGISAVAGGMRFRDLKFNRTAVRSTTASLWLAAFGLLIPSVFHYAAAGQWTARTEQHLSLAIAVVLFATYGSTLLFSLITHKHHFQGSAHGADPEAAGERGWSLRKAVIVLVSATALVALLSEFLVGTVEALRASLGVSEVFVGLIIVAIIGNAAEHSTAVLMAMKNKMDLSLSIAVGSSSQMALFVAPLLVFVSFLMGTPMDLEFTIPETVAVLVAVHIAAEISGDGETNWLEGVQLLSVYVILAILFYWL